MTAERRWTRDGDTWHSNVYPGWRVTDTGRKGRRDRYVIVRPDGSQDSTWHLAHQHKKLPGLNDAMWSAEAHGKFRIP
jgi:hypothetical protein